VVDVGALAHLRLDVGEIYGEFDPPVLLRSYLVGFDLRRALELSGKASGNSVYEENLKEASQAMEQGNSLSGFFSAHKDLFGNVFPSMIAVGEESGDVSSMFKKVSQMYEQDVEDALASLTTIMEPLLILFTGSIIGFIIIAVFLPLYGLLNKLGG